MRLNVRWVNSSWEHWGRLTMSQHAIRKRIWIELPQVALYPPCLRAAEEGKGSATPQLQTLGYSMCGPKIPEVSGGWQKGKRSHLPASSQYPHESSWPVLWYTTTQEEPLERACPRNHLDPFQSIPRRLISSHASLPLLRGHPSAIKIHVGQSTGQGNTAAWRTRTRFGCNPVGEGHC